MLPDDPRQAFLLDPEAAFLNHGSFGALPRAVDEARRAWADRIEAQPVAFLWDSLEEALHQVRARVAAFVGADPQDLVLVDNATTGVNAVLRGMDWAPGDRIVHLSHVYGAVRNTIAFLEARHGVVPVEVPVPLPLPSAEPVLDALVRALPGARLAVLDHICSPSAVVLPADRMVRACRDAGVPVLVDGAHAPGQLPLDLGALGADAYVGNLHKWAFAPRGTAFLHLPGGGRLPRVPLVISHGWRGTFAEAFEWPGTRDFSGWLAAPAGLDLHRDWGGEALMAHNRDRAAAAASAIAAAWRVELPVLPALHAAMALIPLPLPVLPTHADTRALSRRLWREHRVEVPVLAVNGMVFVRISAQVYNRPADYRCLVDAVETLAARG